MHYNLDTLMKLGSIAHVSVPLKDMSDRTKNAIKRGLKRGFLDSTTGQAATYMAILADHVDIPMMAFSKKGRYWNALFMRNLPATTAPALSDWWKVDRTLYRLEKPDEWNEALKRCEDYPSAYTWYGEICNEPDWNELLSKDRDTVRIIGTKELNAFEPIAESYLQTEDYKAKALTIIELIDSGATLNVTQTNFR